MYCLQHKHSLTILFMVAYQHRPNPIPYYHTKNHRFACNPELFPGYPALYQRNRSLPLAAGVFQARVGGGIRDQANDFATACRAPLICDTARSYSIVIANIPSPNWQSNQQHIVICIPCLWGRRPVYVVWSSPCTNYNSTQSRSQFGSHTTALRSIQYCAKSVWRQRHG